METAQIFVTYSLYALLQRSRGIKLEEDTDPSVLMLFIIELPGKAGQREW